MWHFNLRVALTRSDRVFRSVSLRVNFDHRRENSADIWRLRRSDIGTIDLRRLHCAIVDSSFVGCDTPVQVERDVQRGGQLSGSLRSVLRDVQIPIPPYGVHSRTPSYQSRNQQCLVIRPRRIVDESHFLSERRRLNVG
jgi:hypothetical protein